MMNTIRNSESWDLFPNFYNIRVNGAEENKEEKKKRKGRNRKSATNAARRRRKIKHPLGLLAFPNEIVFDIITRLDTVSAVCFALTSHRHFDLVRTTSTVDVPKLSHHIAWNTSQHHRMSLRDQLMAGCYVKLMRRLKTWMPAHLAWCAACKIYHCRPTHDTRRTRYKHTMYIAVDSSMPIPGALTR